MRFTTSKVVLGAALLLALASTDARAHWCDDLWSSGYDIVVRPDSDTSPKQLYVENRWGYQLTNFKLTATSSSGGAITLTPPTTLKVANTLLPGEKGIWKIASGSPAKIEDITFDVRFGDTSGATPKQWACYPVQGANPVMVVKNDGSLFPTAISGIDSPKSNTARGCSLGDVGLGTSLQDQTIADWEDENTGLDALMHIYCSGRGSWGTAGPVGNYAGEGVSPSYCKDSSSYSCPTTKPTASPGSRSDYMHLWAAGALAIRKSALGARLPVVRQRLKCGANDGDPGIAGYTLFALGYLGDDADAKSFLQTQASASGDIGTIAKAALYLMGDTTQKSAVQAGVQSSSVWVKVACAGAVGIVDKDDASVNSAIIPEVKWIEPDTLGGTTDDGKGMYAVHILEIVAFDRRGWVFKGNADGPVTFYGETGGGTGGTSGSGGMSGTGGSSGGGGTSGSSGSGGATAGAGGSPGSGGSAGTGGAMENGGQGAGGAKPQGSGGATGSGGGGGNSSSVSSGQGGMASGGGATTGCTCGLGGRPDLPVLLFPTAIGLACSCVSEGGIDDSSWIAHSLHHIGRWTCGLR
jgi:hypothetical protein